MKTLDGNPVSSLVMAAKFGGEASADSATHGSIVNGEGKSFLAVSTGVAASAASSVFDPIVEDLVEQMTLAFQAGESVDIDAMAAQHPQYADTLRRLVPALRRLAALGPQPVSDQPIVPCDAHPPLATGRRLGDFQIISELGRGGMGIVFEAIQQSLGRRVALKILPAAAVLDPRAKQRFQIEAQAAACLQHPHIIPVYAVDLADEIPYYAMQLIEGRSLAGLIGDLRRLAELQPRHQPADPDHATIDPLVSVLLSDRFETPRPPAGNNSSGARPGDAAAGPPSTTPMLAGGLSGVSVDRSIRSSPYFRSVARLGIQAAQALEYAHGHGIIHRDVKPANLLIDRRGCLWVTDFGLARLPTDSGLTMTGELVGTARYMSPEQAAGKQALIDRRTDIYSLGATLYELLTLRQAHEGLSLHEIHRRIAETEPTRIQSLNPAVPTDLVTVVAKAMAKDPSARYLTAQHLFDDLNRFLEGRPVMARPTPAWVRLVKTARRRPIITAMLLLVQLLLSALVVMGIWSYRRIGQEAEAAHRFARGESLARVASQRTSAALALDRGIALAEGQRVGRGLLWMLRGLESAPPEAGALRQVAAANLISWIEQAPSPLAILPCAAPISALAVSPDGRIVATGGDDGVLALWDADSGRQTKSARTPHVRVGSIQFHPSGRVLATVGQEGGAQLWDVQTLERRGDPMPMATRVIGRIGFDPTGRTFLTARQDGVVIFYDAQTGRPTGPRLDTGDTSVDSLLGAAWRPDGTQIVTFGRNAIAQIWDAKTGRPLFKPLRHQRHVEAAIFRPDGRRVATAEFGTREGVVRIWDADTGRLVASSPTFAGGFHLLAFHPDGRTIAAACDDGAVHVFDSDTGQVRARPMSEGGAVHYLTFSPDGRLLVTGSFDGTVWIFDAATGWPLGTTSDHEGRISGLMFRPDGHRLVTASRDGSARVWDVSSVAVPGRSVPLATGAFSAETSPDGRLLATDGIDGAARVYDAATGIPVLPPLVHANGRVRFARFSPDGRLLATGGDDGVVRIWNVATGKSVGPPLSQPSWALNARFSPDGRRLLVGHTGGTAALWDLAAFRPIGPPLKHPVTHGHEIGFIGFDRSGQIAVTASVITDGAEAHVGCWDAATGQILAPFARFADSIVQLVVGPDAGGPAYVVSGGQVHTVDLHSSRETGSPFGQRIEAIALMPGGKTLLAGGSDKTARLFEVATGRPIGPVMEHDKAVRAVAVSPQGGTLVTLAGERLRFWEATSGKLLGPPCRHRSLVLPGTLLYNSPVFFSPDGRAALTVGGSVVLWEPPGSARAVATSTAGLAPKIRSLTGMDVGAHGDVAMLDAADWQRLLDHGDAPRAGQSCRAPADWHDRLASDGERSGNAFTTRWHLDPLVAARPNDWAAYARRSRARRKAGDEPGADTDLRRARELGAAGPVETWKTHDDFDRATAAMANGNWLLARDCLGRLAQQTSAENPALSWRLAEADLRLGRWDDAEADMAAAVTALGIASLDSMFYWNLPGWLAALRLHNGHHDLYRNDCRKLLKLSRASRTLVSSYFIVWHCSVGPNAVDDPMIPVQIAETALRCAKGRFRNLIVAALGAALYRAGRHDEAVGWLEQAERNWDGDHAPLVAFLAMANQALGKRTEARRWLDRLENRAPCGFREWNVPWDELEVENLKREAEAVVLLDPVFPADPFRH